VILLAVVATNSLPDIIFFDPDGVPVTANFINFVFGNTGGVRLAKSGVYTLGLFQQSGVTDYVFSFNLAKGGANQREAGDGPETLVPGQPVGGHIDRADFDTFSFSAASNDVVHAILKRTGDFRSPYLYLYGPNGTWLGSFSGGPNDTRISNFRLTASGIYTLAVFDGASGGSFDYQLTFHLANGGTSQNEPDDGPEFLEAGQSSGGHLALADYDSFTFSATSNDVAILTVLPTNGVACCPGIFLYGPDGVPITANLTNFGVARTATVRLPMSGVYTLGLLEQVGVMDYVVSFHLAKGGANQREAGDGPEAIAAGQITGGHIGPADYDSFTFNAASNEVLYLTVLRTNGPGAFPYIYLYDPNGTAVIGGSSGSNDARIVNRRLTSTGTYRLLILDDRLQETFDYLVTFNLAQGGINLREDGDGGEVILPGQTVSGHIQPGDYDTFTFSAASNDVIYATVRRKVGPGDFPYIYLYDPDGAVILNGFTSIMDYVHIPGLRLARNGTYTLAVLDDKMTEQFDYSVSLILIPGPNATDPGDGAAFLAAGESRVANLSPGDLDGFSVRAIAGDLLDVTLRSISGPARYPVLRIHAPNGAIVGLDIQLTNARVRLPCVQQSGNYTILVWDDTFGESMTYQLELRQSPVVPRSDGTNQFLAACACADRVVIRWETNAQAAGFQLETTSLAPDDSWPAWMDSAEWKPVNEPYLVISDHFYFVDSVSQTNRFYRLRRPSPP